MKKTTIILILVIQVFLLFIFQNIHALFKEIETTEIQDIENTDKFFNDISRIRKIFSSLTIVTGLLIIGTGFYLIYLYKKSKDQTEQASIHPFQDYLLELKGSETQLKSLVEKQKEHVLEKEELNKSIFNNVDFAIIFINQFGRIDAFNPTAETLFGQSYANAKNNLPSVILSNFPEVGEFIREGSNEKVTKEILSGDRVFITQIIPMENIGQLSIIRDVTQERKREEIERRNGNFAMLGEMAAFLAHEVRNSLGVIFGYTKTLQADKEKIDKVNKEILFLTSMMESFLNFSRPIKIERKGNVDMIAMLRQIASENGIDIQFDNENASIEADTSLLQSIFSNLVRNSQQAGATKLDIRFVATPGKQLEILFSDNGSGIPPENKEKIWYPFFTTRDKGTGMGLAIIRKIINSMKGEISLLESTTPGTTFRIVFYS